MSIDTRPGLRERKKARTRQSIRTEAFRLFDERGYAETTIEQIAESAEVSPSTFFRYFPTKEQLVLADDLDPVIIEAFEAQPPDIPLITAFRQTAEAVFAGMSNADLEFERKRQKLLFSVPELRGAVMQELTRTIGMVTDVIARRIGRSADDIEIRALAGAIVGTMLGVIDQAPGDLPLAVRALEFLEKGLPLSELITTEQTVTDEQTA